MKEKADDLILTAGIKRRAKDLHTVLGRGSQYRPIYCESGVSSTLMITSYWERLTAVTQNHCSQIKLQLLFVLSLLVNTSLDLENISCKKKKLSGLLRCNKICRYRIKSVQYNGSMRCRHSDNNIANSKFLAHLLQSVECAMSVICMSYLETHWIYFHTNRYWEIYLIILTHSTWTWNRRKIRVTWHDDLAIHCGDFPQIAKKASERNTFK